MIDIVVNGILALAEPHYLASVSVDQLERDLIEEVRLFGLFSESEMGEVEQYVERLMEEKRTNRLSYPCPFWPGKPALPNKGLIICSYVSLRETKVA